MEAVVFSNKQKIGTVNLEVGDLSMGGLYGELMPKKVYFDSVQKYVWDFWNTNKPDYKKWSSLSLNIQLENGVFLFAQGGITIDDVMEFPNEPKRIDVAGVDSKIINDFLLATPPRPFTEEPWSELQIGQKITFEEELKKELGIVNKRSLSLFDNSKKHVLSQTRFSAFCHDQRNDDVLFEIHNPNFDKQFALVHLTWKRKKERTPYPLTNFYTDFDEFKHSKMYLDRNEWEE